MGTEAHAAFDRARKASPCGGCRNSCLAAGAVRARVLAHAQQADSSASTPIPGAQCCSKPTLSSTTPTAKHLSARWVAFRLITDGIRLSSRRVTYDSQYPPRLVRHGRRRDPWTRRRQSLPIDENRHHV